MISVNWAKDPDNLKNWIGTRKDVTEMIMAKDNPVYGKAIHDSNISISIYVRGPRMNQEA